MAKNKDTNGEVVPAEAPKEKRKGPPKTICKVSLAHFRKHAKDLVLTFGDKTIVLKSKEFSTGSYGWFNNERVDVEVGGVPAKVQLNINCTLIGSKELAAASKKD